MKVIAIIPARGGSKGVPGKNKLTIDGKPLISYTLEAALESKLLHAVWVSSDDEDILSIAKNFKQIQIHKRDTALASDTSPVTDTVKQIIENTGCDAVMLLQPTAPIRTGKDIDNAITLLQSSPASNSVISVVPMQDIHPARMYWNTDETMVSILSEFEQTRRQDIPTAYYRNGSIYLVRTSAFEKAQSMMVKPTTAYIMPYEWLLNIDEPRDIIIAEALIPAWKKGLLG